MSRLSLASAIVIGGLVFALACNRSANPTAPTSGLAALSACVDLLLTGTCDMMVCAAGQRNMSLQAHQSAADVGLLAMGEGWHNNHHADPRSARHGHRWWEIDNTYLTIRFLAWLGLASDVVTPTPRPKNHQPADSAG